MHSIQQDSLETQKQKDSLLLICTLKQHIDRRGCEQFADVRGFLYFGVFWQPKENELLSYHFKNGNFFEMCAIKTCEGKRRMTNNLPHELPRITKIILDRGVKVTAKLIGKQCYRSLLVKD